MGRGNGENCRSCMRSQDETPFGHDADSMPNLHAQESNSRYRVRQAPAPTLAETALTVEFSSRCVWQGYGLSITAYVTSESHPVAHGAERFTVSPTPKSNQTGQLCAHGGARGGPEGQG